MGCSAAAELPSISRCCATDGRRHVRRDEDLDLGLCGENSHPGQVIGALACAAGQPTDTAEPAFAKELVGSVSWEKIRA